MGFLLSTNTKLIVGVARKYGTGNTEIDSKLETLKDRGLKGGRKAIIFFIFLPGRKQQAITIHTGGSGDQTVPGAPV